MNTIKGIAVAAALAAFLISPQTLTAQRGQAPEQPLGFFITSAGPGDGANLGGLDGADQHCQNLAAAGNDRCNTVDGSDYGIAAHGHLVNCQVIHHQAHQSLLQSPPLRARALSDGQ